MPRPLPPRPGELFATAGPEPLPGDLFDPRDDADGPLEADAAWAATAWEESAGPARGPATVPEALTAGLNPAQQEAVRHLAGPLLVVAGPGSGKTRVLTHRVAALLATGVAPWQVLAVTFTNKAAGEMRERVADLVGPDAVRQMWVATFHSACVRMLRANADAAGLPRTFAIIDTDDARKVVRQVLVEAGMATDPADVRRVHQLVSHAKNHGRGPAELATSPHRDERDAAAVMSAYNARLAALGAVDFDDILLRTLALLRTSAEVRERYQNRFRHVLVDEYQDTNAVQYEIIRILAGVHRNLCVVGDMDQSVYKFRGASPELMVSFNRDWPDATVVVLEENYRSTRAILSVAQAVIDPNPAVHRPRLFTANPPGDPVLLYAAADDRDEAAWVVGKIRASSDRPDEHAVLVRTNFLTRVFEEELTRSGVPYHVVGALRFYDRAEVRDALAYLRVAMNPADAVAFARCVNVPKRGIGETTVAALLDAARSAGVDPVTQVRTGLAAGLFPPARATALQRFLDAYDTVVAACADGPAAALRAVVGAPVGLRAAVLALKDGTGVDRAENLDELVGSAAQFIGAVSLTDPEGRLVADLPGLEQTLAFLENVALVSAAEDTGDDEGPVVRRVQLLTAHASKGKEFPHVHVVGLEEGLFPHQRATDSDDELAEERRLLFVAVSRAERTLTLSYARHRFRFREVVETAPSRFLTDLPSEVRALASRRPVFDDQAGWSRPRSGQRPPAARGGRSWQGFGGGSRAVPPTPAVPSGPRLAAGQLAVGTRVTHVSYGDGVVRRVDPRSVTVAFADRERTLLLELAPLKLTG